MKRRKRCDSCGKLKRDVKLMADPYAEDVLGEVIMLNLCADCAQQSADDV